MTTNAERAETLVRALRAGIERDWPTVEALCTEDVRAWTPAVTTTSRAELVAALGRRDDAFSGLELDIRALDVGGQYACAEWSITMVHTGALPVAGETVVEPTGLQITAHGVTIAEFRGAVISSVRQYWDELSIFEQLGLVARDDGG